MKKQQKNVYKQKSISVQYNGRLLQLVFVFFLENPLWPTKNKTCKQGG